MDTGVDPALFNRFVPLNAMNPDNQANLARKSELKTAAAGDYLFRIGDTASTVLYLVEGQVSLEDAAGQSVMTVKAGEPGATHRLAHQSPRKVSAKCLSQVRYIAIDASLLDVMLTWEQTGMFEVGELTEDTVADADDWMTRLLQMRVFQMVPPSNLQAMFMRLQPTDVQAGQAVIKQGDVGDYFYVIMSGRCMVTRETPNQKPVRLAELETGACFGEEALISDDKRNATVTALTPLRLMRLSKADFRSLLNEPLSRKIDLAAAQKMVSEGSAQWLDVRLPSEYQVQNLPGSINLPLYMLRMKLSSLDPKRTYIAYCDTGRRSSVAAFVLTQKGYDAYVLSEGWTAKA
jgi:CRP-like cAMP-binding protein